MVVGEVPEAVDLLIVGAGPGGYAAALWAAQRGREVTLVDRRGPDQLGGVCLREGCIPSKLLIDVADRTTRFDQLSGTGLVGELRFDVDAFQSHRAAVVDRLSGGVGSLLAGSNVDVRQGSLRFTRPGAAVIHTPADQAEFLQFRDVVIATGSRPIELATLPFDHEYVLDSSELLELEKLPGSLLVVGGGYIGVELGTAYAKLGVAVTIVEQADHLLPHLDERLVGPVRRRLDQFDVEVLTSTRVTGSDDGRVHTSGPNGERDVVEDVVLVSVGRRPNTDELGLDAIGITPRADGRLTVDEDRRLAPHVAAIGDCTPGPALAHKATAEAFVAVDALCGVPAAFAPSALPQVVFSDPPIATTGLTLAQARQEGYAASASIFPLAALGRAVARGATDGFAQLVVDSTTNLLLGAHVVGPMAPELISEATLAIEMGATAEDLSLTVHPHPTFAEQLGEAAHVATGTPLHVRPTRRSELTL